MTSLSGDLAASAAGCTGDACAAIADAAKPSTDHRGSASYKRHMVRTFVTRILSRADGTQEMAA